VSEWVYKKFVNAESTVKDGSAFLTGLLIGLNFPATVPFYVPVVSTFFAIVITKQLFGGLGYNVFNPALMARAFALITWPRAMTTWIEPTAKFIGVDANSTATPLGILKEEGLDKLIAVFGDTSHMYSQLFFGHRAGSLGETSILALLIGAAILIYKRYITWHIPVSFLGTAALLAWIFGGKVGMFTGDPCLHILSGGLILGAFFMATDYVTVPSVKAGQILFGVLCGALTMLIRLKGGFPEGVMFAILIMNCFTPIIDRNFKTKVFGAKKANTANGVK
jgi:electron transport complex protein RnfD